MEKFLWGAKNLGVRFYLKTESSNYYAKKGKLQWFVEAKSEGLQFWKKLHNPLNKKLEDQFYQYTDSWYRWVEKVPYDRARYLLKNIHSVGSVVVY